MAHTIHSFQIPFRYLAPFFNKYFTCLQAVPPAPHEQGPAWLAVNEDGLCVLDYAMVAFSLSGKLSAKLSIEQINATVFIFI